MSNLKAIKEAIDTYAASSGTPPAKIVKKLEEYYFNKEVTENLKLYKKGKKKVSDITKDLKISPRKFYAILAKKRIAHKKYNKSTPKEEV